jgi:hypothetical protein
MEEEVRLEGTRVESFVGEGTKHYQRMNSGRNR